MAKQTNELDELKKFVAEEVDELKENILDKCAELGTECHGTVSVKVKSQTATKEEKASNK